VPALAREGIRVAFTTRQGGVSRAPYASLNLSFSSGDAPGAVRANRARALRAVGGAPESWTGARQVHGTRVVRVDASLRGAGADDPRGAIVGADALWTDRPDATLAVLSGDCVPILLASPRGRRIGVVHAGWRGLLAGVVEAAVRALGEAGPLAAFVGPAIGPCCYAVGEDLADRAAERLGEDVVVRRGGAAFLDLWTGSVRALVAAGVHEVWPAALCTRCEPDRFYSHRAGARGRQGLLARLEG
jgi:YfiH family protein